MYFYAFNPDSALVVKQKHQTVYQQFTVIATLFSIGVNNNMTCNIKKYYSTCPLDTCLQNHVAEGYEVCKNP